MTLRIVSYNIQFGGLRRAKALATVLAGLAPDLVVLQEATDPATVAELATLLALPEVHVRAGESVAMLSRRELAEVVWRPLGQGGSALCARLPDLEIQLVGIHLRAGLSQRGERQRRSEVRSLGSLHPGDLARRVILVGDFNAVARSDAPLLHLLPAWIRMLLRFDGGIRNEVMDELAASGYADVFRGLHPELPGFTMPSVEPSVRLDYVLAGEELGASFIRCDVIPPSPSTIAASDHLPLVADLDLRA